MTDPAAAMNLIALVQFDHPELTYAKLSEASGIGLRRLRTLRDGRDRMKFREQLMLEGMLTDESLSKFKNTWYYTNHPKTFWQRTLTGDKT